MAKTHPPYAPEFRSQMVELVRSGRSVGELRRSSGAALRTPGHQAHRHRDDSHCAGACERTRALGGRCKLSRCRSEPGVDDVWLRRTRPG